MRKESIWRDFKSIKRAWPSARLSNTFRFILIPKVNLPRQFNRRSTPLLIKVDTRSDYIAPECYVDRDLRINGLRSFHLDENITEKEFLDKGWVKLCIRVDWSQSLSLVDYMLMVLDYLENLKE